ncbi:MAG TPA: TPM domain-containing protein [Candidatus Ozemobacteraceae bacterium]|nr:TPM domain-containing protein [Candidatus Ozemobacteraceae bacterium]
MRRRCVLVLMLLLWSMTAVAQTASDAASTTLSASSPELLQVSFARYVSDDAGLIREPVLSQIIACCSEIEQNLKIRIMIKTEFLADMESYAERVDSYFSEWIRSGVAEKRGILLYAGLPRDSLRGKFNLRVGIGLKYLITKEMGEKIVNQVILPNNLDNKDGQGFLEGVLTVKRTLLDEYKREQARTVPPTGTFELGSFLWRSKELFFALLVALVISYFIFFVERCPRCGGHLKHEDEMLKNPGESALGLKRKTYSCDRCGFSRRKKELVYPSGAQGWRLWLAGTRRHGAPVAHESAPPAESAAEKTGHQPPE